MRTLDPAPLVDAFAGRRVLVVGDVILDAYLSGTSTAICREAPVPIVTLDARTAVPGGAGNAAVNVRALGGETLLLSVVGDDDDGRTLREALRDSGVSDVHVLASPSRRTLAKHRIVADSQILLRFDDGATHAIDPETEDALIERLHVLYPVADAIVVSDYSYGVCTPRVVDELAALSARFPRLVVVDSKHPAGFRRLRPTAVKPNYQEVVSLLGSALPGDRRVEAVAVHGARILELTGARIAAVTLDADGAILFERERDPYRTYARPRPHSRATGAGDTFVAAFTLALAAGADGPSAIEVASAASEVVVGKQATAVCTFGELRERIAAPDKRVSAQRLAERVNACRELGMRVVFTNGCFDILHRGHILSLNQAKALGDVLVVALNSDASVRRLKGARRPINPLDDRAQVLAALSCVDHIVEFDEDSPAELLRVVRPDVYAKGGDYDRETLPEARIVEELGGRVEILPFLHDRSTTGVIERIREAYAIGGGTAEVTSR